MQVDSTKLEELHSRLFGELGGAASAALAVVGDRLGFYEALAEDGPATPERLAERTGTHERYVREWLCAQAAAGWVHYDAANRAFSLTPEQAAVLADDASPACLQGMIEVIASLFHGTERVERAFRNGEGVGWHEHHPCLFHGTDRFFRPGYEQNLVQHWIPALDGVEEKLRRGATVADVGCGYGASTLLMARQYEASVFTGFDYHPESIERARQLAKEEGLEDRVRFEVATAKAYPGNDYDLVTVFDALHDMGDPEGASAHIRRSLAPDGTWMIVEPFAHDTLEANLNPLGRIFYSFSTMICTPASKSQEVGLALGAQAGEERLREVVTAGGFCRFRRATETPTNLILEARP